MGFFENLYGSKPRVPTLPRTSLAEQQGSAIQANIAATPEAEQMVGEANRFSREQINQMLESVIPGYAGMTRTASSNLASMLSGEIPDDVSAAVQRLGAARSLAGGFGGSGASRNLVARDLGLTSLDLTQRGLSSMDAWTRTMASIYEPGMMNISSMFISPTQMYQAENEQNLQQFQREWMRNQIRAMPDPVVSGVMQDVGEIVQFAGGMASSYMGGGMGGGGGGSNIQNPGPGSGYSGWGGGNYMAPYAPYQPYRREGDIIS